MNEIEKYMDLTFMGLLAIMCIPLVLVMGLLALPAYIVCKLLKINPDEIELGDIDYE